MMYSIFVVGAKFEYFNFISKITFELFSSDDTYDTGPYHEMVRLFSCFCSSLVYHDTMIRIMTFFLIVLLHVYY